MDPGPNDPPVHELGKMLADELADVYLYLDLLAWHYGIDLPYAIVAKFNLVSARQGFPEELPWPAPVRCASIRETGHPCPDDLCRNAAEHQRSAGADLWRSYQGEGSE